MNSRIAAILFAGAALAAPAAALADGDAAQPVDDSGYFYGLDETSLRREIVDIRNYYTQPIRQDADVSPPQTGYVYFGGASGYAGLWVPAGGGRPETPRPIPAEQAGDVRFGMDWRPELPGGDSDSARRLGRSLTGSEVERIGVRADVTALLFDDHGAGPTAWRVTGGLGSTSLSLVSSDPLTADSADGNGGLAWDIGVGWTSGAVSLSAGYQSATGLEREDASDIAVLSLGADYVVVPGLSVYGEFSLIGEQAIAGDDRMGTVLILGTGLNF